MQLSTHHACMHKFIRQTHRCHLHWNSMSACAFMHNPSHTFNTVCVCVCVYVCVYTIHKTYRYTQTIKLIHTLDKVVNVVNEEQSLHHIVKTKRKLGVVE